MDGYAAAIGDALDVRKLSIGVVVAFLYPNVAACIPTQLAILAR
jgi:hypothetical protein